jgi:hypothetical protein
MVALRPPWLYDACSHFVLMGVNTLGGLEAGLAHPRPMPAGRPQGEERGPQVDLVRHDCDTTTELDMKALVWTPGEALPLDRLPRLFRCPKCGNRNITVAFEVPDRPKAEAAG